MSAPGLAWLDLGLLWGEVHEAILTLRRRGDLTRRSARHEMTACETLLGATKDVPELRRWFDVSNRDDLKDIVRESVRRQRLDAEPS